MTGFSYNLWLDFKMTVFGIQQREILRRKLSTLIRQIIDVSAIVYYLDFVKLKHNIGVSCSDSVV